MVNITWIVLRATKSSVQVAVSNVFLPKMSLDAAELETPGKLIDRTGVDDDRSRDTPVITLIDVFIVMGLV